MGQPQQPTTVAILGTNTMVEKALAQLLEGEGYSTRLLKASSTRVVNEQQLAGVDLVLLASSLTNGACQALLGALRSTPPRTTKTSRIAVIALCSLTKEAPLDEEAVRSVPWPIPFEPTRLRAGPLGPRRAHPPEHQRLYGLPLQRPGCHAADRRAGGLGGLQRAKLARLSFASNTCAQKT